MKQHSFGPLAPVSTLTLGGGGLGMLWGATTTEECVATVHDAVAAGITLLDLAPRYGDGKAELVVGEGARLEHVRFQNESPDACHYGAVQAHQARDSRFISHSISLGGRWARYNIQTLLAGEGADCLMNGLYFVQGTQLVDHHTVIDHAQPRCTSTTSGRSSSCNGVST